MTKPRQICPECSSGDTARISVDRFGEHITVARLCDNFQTRFENGFRLYDKHGLNEVTDE